MGQACAPQCQFGERGCFCTRRFRGPLGPSWGQRLLLGSGEVPGGALGLVYRRGSRLSPRARQQPGRRIWCLPCVVPTTRTHLFPTCCSARVRRIAPCLSFPFCTEG